MSYDNIVKTMKMTGIDGESQVQGTDKEMDVLSFSYDASIPMEGRGPGLSGSGAAYVSPVSVSKVVCCATPKIEAQFYSGKPIGTVTLKDYKADGDKAPAPFVIVTLTNARIHTYHAEGSNEHLELTFEKIEREYFSQSTESSALVSKGKTAFDMLTKQVS
ncbi:type VI secretion system tube protein Hcp [Trinickia sp.]|uniref:type VI secretion system tube protein Hcp n=1 Tax=Trinickia sp. TaxID=2571163 RepID=UPI003F7E2B74